MNLGNVLLKQRRLHEAVGAFIRALELDAQNADAMNNLAYTYSEMGSNLDEAAKLCQQAVTLRPARQAYYLDTLGTIYMKEGKLRAALATFESALAATTERQALLRAGIEQRLATTRTLLAQQPLTEK
jgi:tetratricopeptide (TPR) repeat protein